LAVSPPRTPAAVVQRLVERFYGDRDWTVLAELVAGQSAVADCARVMTLLAAFPDASLVIEDLLSERDRVAARLTLRGTQLGPLAGRPPTGRTVNLGVYGMYGVADERISAAWQGWDDELLRAQLGTGAAEPVLEMDEIQGNVFPGFNKAHVALLGFRVADETAARAALAALADEVATAAEVYAFNRLFADTRKRRAGPVPISATWCNVALSYPALRVFAADADQFEDAAFQAGMHARAPAAASDPASWVTAADPGDPGRPPDLLVILATDTEGELDSAAARLTALLAPGFAALADQRGQTLPEALRSHEHFGFRDGVSQPGLRGRLPGASYQPATARLNPVDPDQGKPGQPLVWPGEFVFGYPRQDGADPRRPGPAAADGPDWARNGSFLVYGRYRQNVGAFHRFAADAAARLAATEPALAGLSADRFAAMVMGRWPSGAPLVRAPAADDPALGDDDCVNNDFLFSRPSPPLGAGRDGTCGDHGFAPSTGDPAALACPYASHIRKANLRDDVPAGGSAAGAQRHRLLRRGIAYGPPGDDDQDRGLLFLAYQTSIERQFEFVLQNWLHNPDLRAPGEGVDVIVGSTLGPVGAFALRVRDHQGVRTVPVELDEPLSTLTGGGYFFAPSISALRHLAAQRRRDP
jgi:Dyp-type peroxidase family